jgi:hypothetical protein
MAEVYEQVQKSISKYNSHNNIAKFEVLLDCSKGEELLAK